MKYSSLLAFLSSTVIYVLIADSAFGQTDQVIQTKGKEFWIGFMKNYETQADAALNVFVTSDQNTTGTVSLPAAGWSQTFTVFANVTTTVTVPNDIAETLTFGTIDDTGVLVETEDTVAVFAINFKGFTADGMRVLPVGALGTEYRVSAYQGLEGFDYNSEMMIVATEDETEIEITPSCDLSSGQQQGQTFTVTLDRGETYQLKSQVWSDEVTGTLLKSTEESGPCRPFAVFSGSDCPNIPYGCFACDHICEQNLPTASWGTKYFLIPFNDTNSYTYKILAHEDGTQVALNGTNLGLDAGEFAEYNDESEVICVESNLPISTIQFMEGLDCGGAGDPAMLILDDANQGIQNITFSTVESIVITSHNLNIIVATNGVDDVLLDGEFIPEAEFSPINSCPDYSYAQIAISQGSHTINSETGVTGYIYGMGGYESYAYALGSFRASVPLVVDEVLCATDTDTINVALLGDYSNIFWVDAAFPDDTLGYGPQFILYPPVETATYVATGFEFASSCPYQEFFSVEILGSEINIESDSLTICRFDTENANLSVDPPNPFYQYEWSPAYGLSNPNTANPIFTGIESTNYSVQVTTPGGCVTGTAEVIVEVEDGNVSNLEAYPFSIAICQGEQLNLNALFEMLIFSDLIDEQINEASWESISGGQASDACGSANLMAAYFNSPAGIERSLTTIPLNVANGGTLYFALKIADGVSPCENADPDEDVLLQYSTGGSFTTIATYNQDLYPEFTFFEIEIPDEAFSANTRFRWIQPNFTGIDEDNWALDQIYVTAVDLESTDISWSPATGLSETDIPNPVLTAIESNVYIVNVGSGLLSCQYSDSVNIVVYSAPLAYAGEDITVCYYDEVVLEAVDLNGLENVTYQWNPSFGLNTPNQASTTINEFGNFSQWYTVTASNGAICPSTDSVYVNILGAFFGLGPDFEYCEDFDLSIWANVLEPSDVLWSTGDTTDFITISETGEYSVTVSGGNCMLSDTIFVEFLPSLILDLGPDILVCDGEVVTLDAGNEPSFYFWNTGSSSQTIEVSSSGLYDVFVYDENFICSAYDAISVEFVSGPAVNLGPNQQLCEGESITLNAGNPGSEFLWNTGETTQSIEVNSAGDYSVIVTVEGCEGTDNAQVDVFEIPVFDLGPDIITCEEVTLNLNPGLAYPEASYLWSTGATTPSITIDDDGIYWCEIQNGPCVYADTLIFIPTSSEPQILMPNVFTPDGDGKNDTFGPEARDLKDYSLQVFNRWGRLIYESTDFNEGWNGKADGSDMASGTYFYILKYEELCTGNKVKTDGTFTLLRQ